MSDTKHAPEKWRAEDLRAQRKARLARMKAKDGGKKPIKTTNPAAIITLVIILFVAMLGVGTWTIIRLGVPHRTLTALIVGNEKIKVYEINYFYHYMLTNYYGIDPTTDDGKAQLNAASGVEGFPKVSDYLKDQAAQQAQSYVMLADNARKLGLALDDADRTVIASFIKSLSDAATQEGVEFENYLVTMYGTGMNQACLEAVIGRQILASKFTESKQDSFTFTADQLQKQYEDNSDTYDDVNYRIFTFSVTTASGASDADKIKADNEAKAKADEMKGKITDDASFKALCIEYAADDVKDSYRTGDPSLKSNAKKADLSTDNAKWLFDASRKSGDKTVIKGTSNYTVFYFIGRVQPEYAHSVNVRHILIKADRESATAAELTAAKDKAQSILDQYLAGGKTEAAFGELAKANSEDNKDAGGLYEDIARGDMVAEFENWCFDETRKPGDTGIVQTQFGYHVMYFVKAGEVDWKFNVKADLVSAAYTSFTDEEIKNYPYKVLSFGMRFVS